MFSGTFGSVPLLTCPHRSKVRLLKIEQQFAFQHEELERHAGSCSGSGLGASPGGSALRAVLLDELSSNPLTAVAVWSVWEFVVSSSNKCFMSPKTGPSHFLRKAFRVCVSCLW